MTDFIDNILVSPRTTTDHIAVDLLDLPDKVERFALSVPSEEVAAGIPEISEEIADNKRVFGEAVQVSLGGGLSVNKDALSRMNWLTVNDDTEVTVYPVQAGCETVAYAVDLTAFHPTLKQHAEALLKHSEIGKNAWNRLGGTIIRYAQKGGVKSMSSDVSNVPLLASKNASSNHLLTRAYFTPLGRDEEKPLVGILGMARTKKGQGVILRILSNSGGTSRNSSLA